MASSNNPVDANLSAHLALQAPWRLGYLQRIAESESGVDGDRQAGAGASCFLDEYWSSPQRDVANHVIVRTRWGMILLNAFPYANGHLLVALGQGRPRLLDYTPVERARLWALVDAAADLAEVALQPQGLNIGMNQGRAGGAGVPGHLHVHVIPRWGGDTNFITTVARVRVIPASLEAMAERFARAWEKIGPGWSGVLGASEMDRH